MKKSDASKIRTAALSPALLSSKVFSSDALGHAVATGAIERIAPGVYIGSSIKRHSLIEAAAWTIRFPELVVSHLTAAEFHNLTNAFPRGLWISIPKGSSVPRSSQFELHPVQALPAYLDQHLTTENGIDVLRIHGVNVRITNPHRTVLDMWKSQKISTEYSLLALLALSKRSDFHVPTFARLARRFLVWRAIEPTLKGVLLS